METIVFDIRGSFAHFRAFDTTRENITYPFPPKTAVIGMIAGIMGLPRNEYWNDPSLVDTYVSIQLLNPLWRSTIRVNYLQTRNPIYFSNSKVKIMIPKDPFEIDASDQRGFYAPVNLNILRNVHFRIFLSLKNKELMSQLTSRLNEKKYCYPPYLGHANMLAEIEYIGTFDSKIQKAGTYVIKSIFPTKALDEKNLTINEYGYSILFNIPIKLGYENDKIFLTETANIIFNDGNQEISASFKDNFVHKITIEQKEINIVFF
ncbi:MAG: type I-B CRISPR-associated protein Cas5 [Candidatus Heimdallarchaeota archaeon]|nr:type I-B CRISPR-associated protein Cas5 [Candidatus Heimdallarchaeota archaeon]